jgi:hypothetical protein
MPVSASPPSTPGLVVAMVDELGLQPHPSAPNPDAWLILLPLLIVLSTFLFLLLFFLICILLVRRRRGISLRDSDGPVDLSRDDLLDSDAAFDTIESRWLEAEQEPVRRSYLRAKGTQLFGLDANVR